jgi:2-polyprenyl-3-methyl-5-hydroxy-6-metoxy-1,4-benzoquinol methylase
MVPCVQFFSTWNLGEFALPAAALKQTALSKPLLPSQLVSWIENGANESAHWHSESNAVAPKKILVADDTTNAKVAYKQICEGASFIYRGDFQNAKQLLQSITRKIDTVQALATENASNGAPDNLTKAFHEHRARQIQRANIIGKVLIELRQGNCELKRAPALADAVASALLTNPKAEKLPDRLLISLREFLGIIGAYEWQKKGVFIDALKENIHASYGVFSPLRGEYLSLIQFTPLGKAKTAFDIGTGTGVIAAILATRGIRSIIATDNNQRALHCALENIQRLNLSQFIQLEQANLFPADSKRADLIVCNPPWIPAKANAQIEHAIYDPGSAMLKTFLNQVKNHLSHEGEIWLILSDLAEHLGLRSRAELTQWIAQADLQIIEQFSTSPKHSKSSDPLDPLYAARIKEITSLYRLKPVTSVA